MAKIEIREDRCKGCEFCVIYCPKGLINMAPHLSTKGVRPAVFNDPEMKCTGCTFCSIVCPDSCIEVHR